jgi:ABC-2 type transport system permease protein
MIDGFRYGITGHNDGNLMIGTIYILIINLILGIIIYRMLKIGYRIKH